MVVLSVAAAEAEAARLADDALREMIAGKTVHLDTPLGTLPITYKDDGTMTGKAGALALHLGSLSDRGRWSVKGDQICQKWLKWFSGESNCIKVNIDGRKVTWRRDDGFSGTATIAANDAPPLKIGSALGGPIRQPEPADSEPLAPPVLAPSAIPEIKAPTTAEPAPRTITPRIHTAALAPLAQEPALIEPHALLAPVPKRAVRKADPFTSTDQSDPAHLRILTGELAYANREHRWCRSGDPSGTPDLVAIALGSLTLDALGESGCISANPGLMDVAGKMMSLYRSSDAHVAPVAARSETRVLAKPIAAGPWTGASASADGDRMARAQTGAQFERR